MITPPPFVSTFHFVSRIKCTKSGPCRCNVLSEGHPQTFLGHAVLRVHPELVRGPCAQVLGVPAPHCLHPPTRRDLPTRCKSSGPLSCGVLTVPCHWGAWHQQWLPRQSPSSQSSACGVSALSNLPTWEIPLQLPFAPGAASSSTAGVCLLGARACCSWCAAPSHTVCALRPL